MKETRQVLRAKERQKNKPYWDRLGLTRLELYYIPMKRKSKNGVEYTYYKKVIDKKGLKN